jgi:cytochrome c55X
MPDAPRPSAPGRATPRRGRRVGNGARASAPCAGAGAPAVASAASAGASGSARAGRGRGPRLGAAVAAALAGVAFGPFATAAAAAEPDPVALERLVLQDCGSCHGMTLKGGLGPDLRPETLAGRDPADLALIILDGLGGSAMPPWRSLLSEAEADWIARYLLKGTAP